MSALTREAVPNVLRQIQDPDVTLGYVRECSVEDGSVKVTINLTTPACPVKDQMKSEAEQRIRELPGVSGVALEMTAEVRGRAGPPCQIGPHLKHIVAVFSGKGGVGKSTVTVNYGPDIPMMMGQTIEIAPEGRFQTIVHIFGAGGAEWLAQRYDFPVIGRVPLNPAVRVGGLGGAPLWR